jgi:mono/diheme cytochrome c family protein
MHKIKSGIIGFVFLFLLTGCALSLAADTTPPPNYQSPDQGSPASVSTVSPLIPPDVANGKLIYEDKCLACHGQNGMGDGVQADKLSNPVAPIGDFEFSRSASPTDWFNVVTNGNIEKFMPGFQSLNDRERWDVIAYVLTIPLSQEEIESGKRLYESTCVLCHASGNDQGLTDFKGSENNSDRSLDEISTIIANGNGEKMPGFSNQFDATEIQSIAIYTRLLGFGNVLNSDVINNNGSSDNGTDNILPEPAVKFDNFSITGNLVNIADIPENQVVKLTAFDNLDIVFQVDTTVNSNGSYQFDNIENVDARVYQLSIEIDGIQYMSDVLHNPEIDSEGKVNLPILIRTITSDPTGLFVERMHVFFDFLDDNTLQIVELFVINNPTDKVIVPVSSEEPSFMYKLPKDAVNLQFEQGVLGERYVEMSGGFGDLQPIDANSTTQFIYAYELPYQKQLDLVLDIPLPVNAAIFMLPSDSIKLKSEQLSFDGDRAVQGMQIQTYSANNLEQNSKVQINLSGKIKSSTQITQSTTTGFIIGGGLFLATIVFAIVWIRRRPNKQEINFLEEDDDLDSLLDTVIALDDAYDKGDIPLEAYDKRRNELLKKIKEFQGSERES